VILDCINVRTSVTKIRSFIIIHCCRVCVMVKFIGNIWNKFRRVLKAKNYYELYLLGCLYISNS